MALEFYAYADESGIGRDDPYCMLGGFIASPRQWKLFRKAWRSVLDRDRVPSFHAVEFFQRASWQSEDSPYHGWSPERANRFLTALLLVLETRPQIKDIGGLVNNADFYSLSGDDRRIATGAWMKVHWNFPGGSDLEAIDVDDPRVLGGQQARSYPASFFMLVGQAMEHVPDGAKVHFIFDIQNVEEGFARENYARMIKRRMEGWEKLGGLTYDRSDLHEPLQAADLYAYIVTNWVARDGQVSPERYRAAETLIGKRRRQLKIRDAASFKNDDERITETIAAGIIRQLAEERYAKDHGE